MQTTKEGSKVITVSRYGSRMASFGNGFKVPIWISSIYIAVRRKHDGILTWRLHQHLGTSTSGNNITKPMLKSAKIYAEKLGVDFVNRIRHGEVCK